MLDLVPLQVDVPNQGRIDADQTGQWSNSQSPSTGEKRLLGSRTLSNRGSTVTDGDTDASERTFHKENFLSVCRSAVRQISSQRQRCPADESRNGMSIAAGKPNIKLTSSIIHTVKFNQ